MTVGWTVTFGFVDFVAHLLYCSKHIIVYESNVSIHHVALLNHGPRPGRLLNKVEKNNSECNVFIGLADQSNSRANSLKLCCCVFGGQWKSTVGRKSAICHFIEDVSNKGNIIRP